MKKVLLVSALILSACGPEMASPEAELEVPAPAQPAEAQEVSSAAYTCPHSLDGADPYETGCANDSYFVATIIIPNSTAKVRLAYSPSCGTNWAVMVNRDSAGNLVALPYMKAQVERQANANYCYRYQWYEYYNGARLWTDMVYARDGAAVARACGTLTPGGTPTNCTGWF